MNRAICTTWFVMFSVFLISCSRAPEYRREELGRIHEKKAWSESTGVSSDERGFQSEWWAGFEDPYLDSLVRIALSENFDMKTALEMVLLEKIRTGQSEGWYLPQANVSANANFYKRSEENILDIEDDTSEDDETIVSGLLDDEDDTDSQYFNANLSVNWEIDLWGKKRLSHLSDIESYNESRASCRAARLKVISEVARGYFQIRQKDSEIVLEQRILENNREKLEICRNQFENGLVAQWKVFRQDAEVKNIEMRLLRLKKNRKHLENRMAVILAMPPGEFAVPNTAGMKPPAPFAVPAGLPSHLLSRRPDLVAAEHRLIKTYYELGVARASRLPTISLTGTGGFSSNMLSDLLEKWSLGFMPSFTLPVFDGGSGKARVESAKVQIRISENQYLKAAMIAFEEVENALANIRDRVRQISILQEKTEQMKLVRSQTAAKFEMGLLSQLEILDTDRELYTSERALIEAEQGLLDDTVVLVMALGGGWPDETPNPESTGKVN